MPVVFDTIGIQSLAGGLIENVETESTVENVVVKSSSSGFGWAGKHGVMNSFTVKGSGDVPDSVALAAGVGVSDLFSGGISLVTSIKTTENNDNVNTFEYSGVNAPGASAAVA